MNEDNVIFAKEILESILLRCFYNKGYEENLITDIGEDLIFEKAIRHYHLMRRFIVYKIDKFKKIVELSKNLTSDNYKRIKFEMALDVYIQTGRILLEENEDKVMVHEDILDYELKQLALIEYYQNNPLKVKLTEDAIVVKLKIGENKAITFWQSFVEIFLFK